MKRPSTARVLFSIASALSVTATSTLVIRQILDSIGVKDAFTLGSLVSAGVQLLIALTLYAASCAASLLELARKTKP